MSTLTNAPLTVETAVERARALADHFRVRLADYDRRAVFPAENFDEIREAGLHTLTVPTEYGGLGMWELGGRFTEYYQVIELIAYADSSTAQLLQVHCHATGMIAALGTPAQRAFYMSEVVDQGRLIASIGSEAQLKSTEQEVYKAELVRRPGGDYVLNAKKAFGSLAGGADYFNIWTAVEGPGGFADRMVVVTVPRDTPGFTMEDNWDTLGMRHTTSWALNFENVQVPEAWVVGAPGAWIRNDQRTFTLAYAANHLGTAQAAFDFAASYVGQRPHLAKSEIIQARLGDLSSKLYAARCAVYSAASRWDNRDDPNQAELDGIRALHLAKRLAIEISNEAYDLCGARVAHNMYALNQIFRDVRAFTLHFRDDLYTAQVGRAELGEQFVVKGDESGSTPHDQA
jgi:alkylation response protein AidB-like acyl-CoA dehydrogenase